MRSPSKGLLLVLIIVCIAIVYAQAVRFEFVTYDDIDLVVQNTTYLSDLSNLFTSFTTHIFSSHRAEGVYYRPILMVTYILDYQLWSLNPLGYHLTNIVLHCVTAILVFLLINQIIQNNFLALSTSLLFALHPIQTESVAWVAGRNDVLLGIFIVLMMVFYTRYRASERNRTLYVSLTALSYTLAIFTKESGVFYIFLLPLYDMCVLHIPLRQVVSLRSFLKYLWVVIVLIGYFLIRLVVFEEFLGAERLYGGYIAFWDRILMIPIMVSVHLAFLVFPVHLSVTHPLDQLIWIRQPWVTLAVAFTLLLLVAIWWTWSRDRIFCYGLLWLTVGLLPALNIIPVAVPILEHRLYVPMVGFAIALSRGLLLLSESLSKVKVFRFVTAVVILVLALLSYQRLPVWQNSISLWTDAISKEPMGSRSYLNLAGTYFDLQQYDKTIELLKKYIELKPDDSFGYSKLRQTYYLVGQYEQAALVCRQMITLNPRNQHRYIEAAKLYEQFNLVDSALALYNEALNVDSTFVDVHYHRGALLERQGDFSNAERAYRAALRLNPGHTVSHIALGKLYAQRGDLQQAILSLELGIRSGKPSQEIVQLLGSLYVRMGQHQKAQELFQRYRF
ncbi:MAG: tetratricopeptide repeat protein [Ignavibacteriae bacterium]|nr:tetratricopeptide repeat protein [Ignavibacteriota bacterium]